MLLYFIHKIYYFCLFFIISFHEFINIKIHKNVEKSFTKFQHKKNTSIHCNNKTKTFFSILVSQIILLYTEQWDTIFCNKALMIEIPLILSQKNSKIIIDDRVQDNLKKKKKIGPQKNANDGRIENFFSVRELFFPDFFLCQMIYLEFFQNSQTLEL